MFRLAAILLIPIFVVGNSFVHSHGAAAHSPGHSRTHIHVAGASHHERSHASDGHHLGHDHGHVHRGKHHVHDDENGGKGSQQEPIESPLDHDSDAIYLVAADLTAICTDRFSVEFDSPAEANIGGWLVNLRPKHLCLQPHRSPPLGQTLYLLHAALRL